MKVILIIIQLILLIEISFEHFKISIDNKMTAIILENIILSTNIIDSICNNNSYQKECNASDKDKQMTKKVSYFYLDYEEYKIYCNKSSERILMIPTSNREDFYNESFREIDINNIKISIRPDIYYIFSLNSNSHTLIILDYINKSLIFENDTQLENENIFTNDNLCYNNSLNDKIKGKKFICKLDYILFGHEDLKKDDVYLAKEINEEHSIAILDNLLSYSIFPADYLDYFFSSFFSELNDKCQKNKFNFKGYENTIYYITCPKKKIELYTKRRKLNVIINKFSYKIVDLFQNSLDFLDIKQNNDIYYFNIVFEKDRQNFSLGKGFFKNKKFGYHEKCTYIFSLERNNYTEDLTDINSVDFEIWLYILTTFSFTFLLLIFTIFGCIHSKKINKELKEMLK